MLDIVGREFEETPPNVFRFRSVSMNEPNRSNLARLERRVGREDHTDLVSIVTPGSNEPIEESGRLTPDLVQRAFDFLVRKVVQNSSIFVQNTQPDEEFFEREEKLPQIAIRVVSDNIFERDLPHIRSLVIEKPTFPKQLGYKYSSRDRLLR